jgi:DNA replication protein DnaC
MSLLAPPILCPRCNGSGWVPLSGDSLRVEACLCQGDLRRRQRIAAANIPRRYLDHCTLHTFYEKNNASLFTAKRRVQEFCDAWPMTDSGRGLLLVGACGVGKTHLAVAALMELIASDKRGRLLFSNFQDLIQEIQASFDEGSAVSKSELLRPLIEADLLVLDELGSQKPTTFVQDMLYYIVNTRYNDERATIFTTNYFDDAAIDGQRLADRIGDRLRSRLHEMTELVAIKGAPDHRITSKMKQNTI